MKKIGITIICVVFLTTPVFAGMEIQLQGRPYPVTQLGGAFTVQLTAASDPIGYLYDPLDTFETFCLERDEFISLSGTYDVLPLSNGAIHGGLGGPDPDPISDGTIRLYKNFLASSPVQRAGLVDKTQLAIWYGEQEMTASQAGAAAVAFYNDAQAGAGIFGQFVADQVQVMNLTSVDVATGDIIDHQSLLVHVPVPGALLLGFLGLGAAGVKLRKYA